VLTHVSAVHVSPPGEYARRFGSRVPLVVLSGPFRSIV
jgi:hypothetical protein